MRHIESLRRWFTVLIALLSIVLLFSVGPAFPSSPYERVVSLSKGKFLVATRNINDIRFEETVLLLTQYGQDGTVGLVVNRPSKAVLSKLLPDVKGLKNWSDMIYWGGPVDSHRVSFLIRSSKQPKNSGRVFKDVYIIGMKEVLQSLMSEGGELKVRAYMGYAGWAPGQLEKEVMRGDWLVAEGDASTVFEKEYEGVWEKLYNRWSTQEIAGLR